MIKKLFNAALIVLVILGAGCKKNKDDEPKEWNRGSDFEGIPRSGAASFTVDGKTYLTGGYDGTKRLNDLWYYDDVKRNWFRIIDADFPGKARNYAVGFSINGKGYIGGGSDGSNSMNDFYEFNPVSKTWKAIAAFPGESRYGAIAFSGNGKGFVGSGTELSGDMKDFYSYDPQKDLWEKAPSLPGTKRANAFTFTLGDDAYVGGGKNNGSYLVDFWKFNTKTNEWTKLNDLSRKDGKYTYNVSREFASTFVLGNTGFVVGGNTGGILNTMFSYDASIDAWKEREALGGSSREAAIAFSANGKGFITTGRNGSLRFDDTWVFTPKK